MPHPGRTRKPAYDTAAALAHLSSRDAKLRRLIERAGPFTMKLASKQSPFEALLESIVYQQLHGKAAAAIHARLLASFAAHRRPRHLRCLTHSGFIAQGGSPPIPPHRRAHPRRPQRAAPRRRPLRTPRLRAIRDLAAKTLDGTVPTLARIRRMSDAAIIEHLTQVRGIASGPSRCSSSSASAAPTSSRHRLRRPQRLRPHLRNPQAHRQSHPRRPPRARRHGSPRQKVAPLVLRRHMVPLARLRPRQCGETNRLRLGRLQVFWIEESLSS